MPLIDWVLNLTPHQLDVLRTIAIVLGSGCVPVFGFVLTWFARVIKIDSRQAKEQTATRDWIDGVLRTTPVAEIARHAMFSGEAARQEVSDLGGWIRGNGRRRLPTDPIPIAHPPMPGDTN